jgi:hypothetical protein
MPYQSNNIVVPPHSGTWDGVGLGGGSVKPLTGHNSHRQLSSWVMRTGRDGWSLATEHGHGDKISVVLITSVCNVIYP